MMESAVAARLTEVGPCQVCLAREGMSRLKGLGGWPMLSSAREKRVPCPSRVLGERAVLLEPFDDHKTRGLCVSRRHGVFIRHSESSHKEVFSFHALGTEEISASGWHSFRYLQVLSPRATAGNRVRALHLCDYVGKSTQLVRVLRDRICRHARTRSSAV